MRLWPTTQLFGRVTTSDVRFPTGAILPAGTQVLIYNLFNHRNRDRIEYLRGGDVLGGLDRDGVQPDLGDVALEHTQRVRVGHHQRGHVLGHRLQ